jgi:hypothetical protein
MTQILIWTAIIDIYILLAIDLILSIYKKVTTIKKISEKKKDEILLEEYKQIYDLSDPATFPIAKVVSMRLDKLIKRMRDRYND